MRYRLTIAYDGTDFHGWQEQTGADQVHLRTVQKTLRQAIQHVVRQPVQLTGASRTDTGVHALGQVATFDAADLTIPLDRMALAINSRLPADVEVRAVDVVADDFQPIADAVEKQYRYRIWNAPQRPLGLRHLVHHFWEPLDVEAMADAGRRLVGTHDFAAFTNAGHGRTTTVRTVTGCRVEAHPIDAGGRQVHVVVRGQGFLYNMVRIIAGTLMEIGRGHWPADRVDELLRTGDRQRSGPTAPAQALCLESIRYAESN